MVWSMVIVGSLLCLIGVVWIGQGVGVVGGSFMTGEGIWAVIGAVAFLAGATTIRQGLRHRTLR
jgi:hypothetical protein